MKLTLTKEDLNKGLQTIAKIAQSKTNNLQSSNGFLLKALHNVIEIPANDYEMGIKTIVPGIIEEPGETFIANPYLIELIHKLPSDSVQLCKKDTDTKLLIIGGSVKFECATMNISDFNEVEIVESGYAQFTTNSIILKDLIDHTSFACSTNTERPIFMGTHLDVEKNRINMVATDTHRLALKTYMSETPITTPIKVTIPSRLLMEISRNLPIDIPEPVTITAVRNYLAIRFSNVYIKTRLIEGEYPKYERVIPKDFQCTVTTDRAAFTSAVERVSLVVQNPQYNLIKFSFSQNQIKLMSRHPDYGVVEDLVACDMTGEDLTISFNSKYILDLLKHCHEEKIIINLRTQSPVLIKDKDDSSCVFVVTPMREK